MKTKDELIYDLIFSETMVYRIDIAEYLDDIYGYEEFVAEIKKILKKSSQKSQRKKSKKKSKQKKQRKKKFL